MQFVQKQLAAIACGVLRLRASNVRHSILLTVPLSMTVSLAPANGIEQGSHHEQTDQPNGNRLPAVVERHGETADRIQADHDVDPVGQLWVNTTPPFCCGNLHHRFSCAGAIMGKQSLRKEITHAGRWVPMGQCCLQFFHE